MADKYVRITRQIGISFLSNFLIFLLTPLLIIILTRSLSLAEFGVYSLLSTTIAICTVLFDFSLSNYIIVRFSGLEKEKKLKGFFAIYLFEFIILVFIMAAMLLTPLSGFLANILGLQAYRLELVLTFFIIFQMVLLRIKSAYYISEQRLELNSAIAFMQQCLWIIILAAFILITGHITLANVFFIWVIGTIIAFLFSFANLVKGSLKQVVKNGISASEVRYSLLFSLPLLPYLLGIHITGMSDRYMLNHYANQAVVGLYTLAYSLTWLTLSVAVVVGEVFRPYIAEAWNRKEGYNLFLNASLKYGLVVVIPLLTGLLIMREQIVTMVSGPSYLAAASVIPILLLGPFLEFINYVFYQPLMLKNRTKLIGFIAIVGAFINISLNFLLIPKYGMNGAAIATVISYLLVFIMIYSSSRSYIALEWRYIKLKRILIAAAVMGSSLYVIINMFNPQSFAEKILLILLGGLMNISLLFSLKVFDSREIGVLKSFINESLFLLKKEKGLHPEKKKLEGEKHT